MAVQCTGPTNFIKRLTNIVAGNVNYTCVFWFRQNGGSSNANYHTVYAILDDPITYSNGAAFYLNTNPPTTNPMGLNLDAFNATDSPGAGVVLTDTQWYSVGYIRNGSNHSFYLNGIEQYSVSEVLGATLGFLSLGSDTDDNDLRNLQFYSFKEWNTNLTPTQLLAEVNSPTAIVHATNLWTFTQLSNDLTDSSGNGHDWTAVGSPTFVSDPSFPTNTTSATALDLTSLLPYTNNSPNFGDFPFELWYKYTASADSVISFIGYGTNSGLLNNILKISVYNSSIVSPFNNKLINIDNVPIQFPVPSGQTYYVKVTPNADNKLDSEVIQVKLFTQRSVPMGSYSIPDDTGGFPLALLTTDDDSVLSFVFGITNTDGSTAFGEADAGTMLPDGTFIWQQDNPNDKTARIYDSTFSLVTTVTFPTSLVRANSNNVDTFYILYRDVSPFHYKISKVSKTGTIGTTYDLGTTTVVAFCVNSDDTILYYQQNTSGSILRWDLVNNIAMSNLVTKGFSGSFKDMLYLTDNTIIQETVDGLLRYDTSGTLLDTYTPGTFVSNTNDRLCVDITADDFIYWSQDPAENQNLPSVIYKIKVSDGTIISQKNQTLYENGAYFTTFSGPPPTSYFGSSESCPIMVTRTLYLPPGTGGTIVVGKGSNPLASGNFTVTGPNGTFTIATEGTEEIDSLAAGTYSIVETPDVNYATSYFVSNDPVNNNNTAVVLGDGDLVDVVIVNSLATKYGGLYEVLTDKNPDGTFTQKHDTLRNQDGTTVDKMINWFFELFTDRDK